MDQRSAPVLEALAAVERRPAAGFGAPGHGGGRAATADVRRLVGLRAFKADVLTPKGLDDRTETGQVLQRAHAVAADAWGADLCRFVTGGSTQGLHTALAAVARPGDTVLMAQNAHKAEVSAAVFAGLNVEMVPVAYDRGWDLEHGVSPQVLAERLDARPHARAALVVSPSYFGVTSDVAALAEVCHARGKPLIVDAAWGAAFGFCSRLPQNPVAAGADIVVVSAHKTLAALGQGSVLLASGDLVDQERLALAYELFETTSPSVPILASLDATRREHALNGEAVWSRVVALAEGLRKRLSRVKGVRVLGRDDLPAGGGAHDLDVTKVALDISALGVSGYAADDWLMRTHRVSVGLGDARHLLVHLTPGVTAGEVGRLRRAVAALAARAREPGAFPTPPADTPRAADLGFDMALPAQDAFTAETEKVPYEAAAGRVAAEVIAPAPPAVPRLIPGQRITAAHVAFLVANRDLGAFVLDPADPRQREVRVVRAA